MPRDASAIPVAHPPSLAWTALAPAVFVVLWSTGFVAAKTGLAYAEPFTFLFARFAIVTAAMLIASLIVGAAWPRGVMVGHIAVVGLLMHASYLGGVFTAIMLGMPAWLIALVVGLQPILTATVAGPLLGERVSGRQWLGLVLGFGGVAIVLVEGTGFAGAGGFGGAAIAASIVALLGATGGTLYQKRYCAHVNIWTGAVIQYTAAGAALLVPACLFETMHITWSGPFIASMAWLTVVLSVGTVSLLYLLIRRGAVSKLASLFFLIPPTTALIAWAMLGETLNARALAGMAVAAVGVALVQRG
ncbi:MAG TPA: DMT family transporter [Alphaproteobacteria bacterium]|nr:DMT family transporter [Alphaproteobacteria bacterium]